MSGDQVRFGRFRLDLGRRELSRDGVLMQLGTRGRVAIVVDDGIATGATTRAALRATRMRKPSKLVLAVPVAPTDTLVAMREEADDVVCLEDHEFFGAIGLYYSDFGQTADQEVIDAIARFPVRTADRARVGLSNSPTRRAFSIRRR
jgi:putative phosphoribosyl transferase